MKIILKFIYQFSHQYYVDVIKFYYLIYKKYN